MVLGRVRPVGRIGPSRTGPTSPTRQSPNTDSYSFAPFVLFRGLKISTEFLLFSSHERHKSAHKRERANNSAFLRADTIRLLADFLIASADRIRKPADTIRKPTDRIRRIFTKNSRKNEKTPPNLDFPQDFDQFFPLVKSKMPQNFWQKAPARRFRHLLEGMLLSIFQKVFGVLGQVGLAGLVRDSVEKAAYRISRTGPTRPRSNKAAQALKWQSSTPPYGGDGEGLPFLDAGLVPFGCKGFFPSLSCI